mmetsp:Transcript_120958/g.342191  ORF Transcript_120958/g.342191 Transcript_120958/m.342191 type:complete len:96 (+) Transcript_120958:2527-2814(+)
MTRGGEAVGPAHLRRFPRRVVLQSGLRTNRFFDRFTPVQASGPFANAKRTGPQLQWTWGAAKVLAYRCIFNEGLLEGTYLKASAADPDGGDGLLL